MLELQARRPEAISLEIKPQLADDKYEGECDVGSGVGITRWSELEEVQGKRGQATVDLGDMYALTQCHGVHCVPPTSYVEAVTSNVTAFGDGAFRK